MSNPQAPDIKKRLIIEDALIQYNRLTNFCSADLDELYAKIEKLNADCFVSEKAMDLVCQYRLDEISSKDALKERIVQMREQITQKIFGQENKALFVSENSNAIAYVIEKSGINKPRAEKLAQKIWSKDLTEGLPLKDAQNAFGKKAAENNAYTWADLLTVSLNEKSVQQTLHNNAGLDLYTYQKMSDHLSTVDDIIPTLEGNLDGTQLTFSFRPNAERDAYLRQDFDSGIKRDFLSFIGNMARHGRNLVMEGSSSPVYYTSFEKSLQKYAPEDFKARVDQALGIKSPSEAEKARRQAFDEKSKELYTKLMVGMLSEKIRQSDGKIGIDYASFCQTLSDDYIKGLCAGVNDLKKLDLLDKSHADSTQTYTSKKEEFDARKQMLDDVAEKKVATVHHHLPLGSAHDITLRLSGNSADFEAETKALIHQLGNMCFVVGKEKHESMEARGAYTFKQSRDTSIFAARVNVKDLNIVRDRIERQNAGTFSGKKLFEQIDLYLAGKTGTVDLSCRMDLPESKAVQNLRAALTPEKKKSMSNIIGNFLQNA